MGCGASLKVTAISQPTNKKKEAEEENKPFRVTRFKFKLPSEVLQGFGDVLKIITRKSEKRRRPLVAEPSEVSVDQLLSSQSSHHPSHLDSSVHEAKTHVQNHRFSLPETVLPPVEVKEDHVTKAASLLPLPFVAAESSASKDASPGLEVEDLSSDPGHIEAQAFALTKQQTIEAQVLSLDNQPSMFTRVEEQMDVEQERVKALDESDLLSPEAPRVLPEEEEEEPVPDLSAQRSARLERDRLAKEEAERLAQNSRQQAEAALAAQESEIAQMEGAAQSILSKYQQS